MNGTTRVDLHCHSTCSDGLLEPEVLAQRVAAAGVVCAALTDHDTVDGLVRFAEALHRQGVGCVSGVELTTSWQGEEVHLLAFGFDPTHPELLHTLRLLRQRRAAAVQSVADTVRRIGSTPPGGLDGALPSLALGGPLEAVEAIALVHRVGGRVFLAHPTKLRLAVRDLRGPLVALRTAGLDGIEALYASDPPDRRAALCDLARELGLLVCAGSDYHGPASAAPGTPGLDMPNELWQPLRDALRPGTGGGVTGDRPVAVQAVMARLGRRPVILHIVLPSVLAVGLFAATIWGLILPSFERSLMDRKREMITELTHAAWSILADAERQVQAGRIARADAQREARDRIAALRYGRTNKDYFWIQDMYPRMVMHPYRTDLNGQDLREFRDPRGARIFVEFADVVRRHREGLVDYVWQWPDDAQRLEPKESYVKGFEPWGWVIGTGIYLEDVHHEIKRLERGIVHAALGITVLVALLLAYMARFSQATERRRAEAVDELREATERYRTLVEAATEGTLLVLERRCRYANPHLLDLLGCTLGELELLDLTEVLPPVPANAGAWQCVDQGRADESPAPTGLPGELRRRDGRSVACTLALTHIAFGNRIGLVLLAREVVAREPVAPRPPSPSPAGAELLAEAPVGLFRARVDHRGTLQAANAIATRFLRPSAAPSALADGAAGGALADLFHDAPASEAFLERVQHDGVAECRLPWTSPEGHRATLALRAALLRDAAGRPLAIGGTLEDVSSLVHREQAREVLIERLQSSLLFLHEPVGRRAPAGVFCTTDAPVRNVAAQLAASNATAALVREASGAVIGIATDRDLCTRVLAAGVDPHAPIRTVMNAPVITISERAPVYEALLRMQESSLRHLAVTDAAGSVLGVVSDRDLLPFQHYGAIVLTREISRASLVGDVVRSCRRTPAMIKALLDSGAHPRNITRLASSICDAATERFMRLALEELGPPPARFAFLALGSQGRQEQTLLTDQDNAIVYAPAGIGNDPPEAATYFTELGRRVCGWLDEAGYPFCRGRFMAMNPVWSRTLTAWKTHFSHWAASAGPDELLTFAVFFDFRAVCGDADLARELRQHVLDELRTASAFFPHFARHALGFKPPVIVLGRVLMGGGQSRRGQLDLKDAMMPVVAFARLYALRHGIDRTHTLERLDALVESKALPPASRDELLAAYDFLTRLRLRSQAQALHAGQPATNVVTLRSLGYSDRALLRQALAQIKALQRRISYDFLGGATE